MFYQWTRIHLVEIHEQPWCPAYLRDGATDYLRFISSVTRQYHHVIPLLRNALAASASERIVDLCSGGGGPWPQLHRRLHAGMSAPLPILLTDVHPNQAARQTNVRGHPHLHFVPTPVDATMIPAELSGFRTLFTAFHHFEPEDARAILQDAVDQHQGIAVFEQTDRSLLALVMMLVLPWLSILAAPFVRPFRFSRLFWTCVIPLIPLVLCVDGIVSCLRTHTPEELEALIAGLKYPSSEPTYRWEVGRMPSPLSPVGIIYAVGYPERAA